MSPRCELCAEKDARIAELLAESDTFLQRLYAMQVERDQADAAIRAMRCETALPAIVPTRAPFAQQH